MSKHDQSHSEKNTKKTKGKKKSTQDLDVLLQELSKENEQLRESVQRERADSDNIRKRHESQLQELKSFVAADTVRALLPAIDNIERALAHTPKDLEGHEYVKGIQGIAKQFATTFEKLGVTKIATVGESFDPSLHEAISMDDSEGEGEEVVSEELQSGYKMGDHVIRHAMVRVALEKK